MPREICYQSHLGEKNCCMRDQAALVLALSHYAIPQLYHPPSAAELRKDRRAPFIVYRCKETAGSHVFYGCAVRRPSAQAKRVGGLDHGEPSRREAL